MRVREPSGDGRTPTHLLEPCRCPGCGEELEVTCPNRCENAHEGARGTAHAAQYTKAPRHQTARVSARILAEMARTNGPISAADVMRLVGGPSQRASAQLHYMMRSGKIRRVKHGQYALMEYQPS